MDYFINAKMYIENIRTLSLEELELERLKYNLDLTDDTNKEFLKLLIKKQEAVVELAKYDVDKYFKLIDGKTPKNW